MGLTEILVLSHDVVEQKVLIGGRRNHTLVGNLIVLAELGLRRLLDAGGGTTTITSAAVCVERRNGCC